MFLTNPPRRRPDLDSSRLERPLEPADRHARRLGVLGHAECRRNDVLAREGQGRAVTPRDLLRVLAGSAPPKSSASVLPFPMIAA